MDHSTRRLSPCWLRALCCTAKLCCVIAAYAWMNSCCILRTARNGTAAASCTRVYRKSTAIFWGSFIIQ